MPLPLAIPAGGIAGLRFLDQTLDRQVALFNRSPDIEREINHFVENAATIRSVDDLMGDRRSLAVVLGAFGLDEDLNKGAFIRKVIEEGTLNEDAFATRLVEPAYREMSEFLGFGDFGGTLVFETTRLNIVDRFRERQFELAAGEIDVNLRLALNFRREAQSIVESSSTDDVAWLRLLGSQPLRAVVESALNLPSQFALIDLDQQVKEVTDRAASIFGSSSPRDVIEGDGLNRFVDRFLLNDQVRNGQISSSTRGSTALSLLQASGLGSAAQANLFQSAI